MKAKRERVESVSEDHTQTTPVVDHAQSHDTIPTQADQAGQPSAAGGGLASASSDLLQTEKPRPAHWFKPGQSGNPSGGHKGALHRLRGGFTAALAADFEKNGKAAIEATRKRRPAEYLRIVASLMPKQIEVRETPFDDVDDEALRALIFAARSALGLASQSDGGEQEEVIEGSARELPTLPEAS